MNNDSADVTQQAFNTVTGYTHTSGMCFCKDCYHKFTEVQRESWKEDIQPIFNSSVYTVYPFCTVCLEDIKDVTLNPQQ